MAAERGEPDNTRKSKSGEYPFFEQSSAKIPHRRVRFGIYTPCAHPSAALLDGVPSKTPVCRFQPILSFPVLSVENLKGSRLCCASFAYCRLCFLPSLYPPWPKTPATSHFTTFSA